MLKRDGARAAALDIVGSLAGQRDDATAAPPLAAEFRRSAYRRTFWPGCSTCTPATTIVSPALTPPASTTSLPSAPATRTGCCLIVIVALSSTQTAGAPLA